MAKPPKGGGLSEATRLLRVGGGRQGKAATVAPSVQRASTVLLPEAAALYDPSHVTYGRNALNTHEALCEALCELEAASYVGLYSCGLNALTGAMLAVLQAGDDVLVVDCAYAPTRRFCENVLKRFGIGVRYFPPRATAEEVMALALPNTRLVVMETPGSLTFEMQDVAAVAGAARAGGILTLIDNTYGAGLLFKPLRHGVDISVQALTKYVGGHSDLFMGSAAVADAGLAAKLKASSRDHGGAVSPDDAWGVLRGLRTLPARLERHGASGLKVAGWAARQPEVARVLHPGLEDFPDHALFKRDFAGPNGLFSLVLKPVAPKAVLAMLDAFELFGLGFSWGGYESLAIHGDPQLGVRKAEPWEAEGPLVRLHVGLEDPDDLIADLRRGLDALASVV